SGHYPPSLFRTVMSVVQGERDKGYVSYLAARSAYQKMLREQGEYVEGLQALAVLDALFGSKEDALREIQNAIDAMPASRDPLAGNDVLSDRALIYAWLGERDKAFEQLTAISGSPNSPPAGDLKLNPIWDPLRDDPRFPQLVAAAAKPIALDQSY